MNRTENSNAFKTISGKEWDEAVSKIGGNVFLTSAFEGALLRELSFVAFIHYLYRGTHALRLALINGRATTTPFSEGGDVFPLTHAKLDLEQFKADVRAQFGESMRLRINERIAPVMNEDASPMAAEEQVVDLSSEILPLVRKTLRHILKQPFPGECGRSKDKKDIETAYRLYLRHMRSVRNFAMPKPLFISLLSEMGGDLWVWRHRGKVRAAALFTVFKNEVLYTLSSADSKAQSLNAPHHLVYEALIAYQKEGKRKASLGATGSGSPLLIFKRGWRGTPYRIFEIGERQLVSKKSAARELAGLVPLPFYHLLTTKLGKYLL